MKRLASLTLAIILALTLVFTGCGNADQPAEPAEQPEEAVEAAAETPEEEEPEETQQEFPVTLTDQVGREVTIEAPPETLVSGYMISSSTLISLDLTDRIVGIENNVKERPFYSVLAPTVQQAVEVGTAKEINIEEIASLHPDLVILPFQQEDAAEQLEELDIPTLVVMPETLDDYMEMVLLLGKATGTTARAEELVNFYNLRLEELEEKLADVEDKPTALVTSNSTELRAAPAEMFQADLVKIAGGTYVADDLEGDYWADVSLEQISTYNPEYLFIGSQPKFELEDVTENAQWAEIQAVKDGNVYVFPSDIDNWERPGFPALLGSYWAAWKMHPEQVTEDDVQALISEFYQLYYGADITLEDLGIA